MKANKSKNSPLEQAKDENDWKKIIADQEASHLTRLDYCRDNQLNYHAFGYWYRKLKHSSINSLIPIKIKSELEPTEKNKVLSTLTLTNGVSLHIYDKEALFIILNKMI
jgi:hypothetical protein